MIICILILLCVFVCSTLSMMLTAISIRLLVSFISSCTLVGLWSMSGSLVFASALLFYNNMYVYI